jgi:hypothetical protein
LHGGDAQGVWDWIDTYCRDRLLEYIEPASSPADTSALEASVAAAAYRLTQAWRDTPLFVARPVACWPLAGPSPDTPKILMLSTGPMRQAILQPEQTHRS